MISSAAWACIERDKRILQNTISSTERGAMIAWLEMHCYWPVPNWADDEDVKRLFWKCSDSKGGFVKVELVTATFTVVSAVGTSND
jgi:hypothetical protein